MAEMLRNELGVETDGATPLTDIFDEEPPPLSAFISDARYLDQRGVVLGGLQYDFIRHFEQILFPETYILMVEEFGEYWNPVRYCNEYAVEWGKGSGKDYVCQLSFSRLSNILLSLKNPQEYYNLGPDTILHLLNVAATAPQAHGVFFKPMRSMLTRSPWFEDKFQGGELPGPQAGEMRFIKQIELISGHSQADNLEGKNLIAGVADEIAAFKTESEVMASKSGITPSKTAKAILSMLKTSSATRFPETYRIAQISFPRYKGDAIEQAILKGTADNAAKGLESRHFVSGPHATWSVNPRYDKFERIEVAGATQPVPNVPLFIEDYETDPAEARAKYECKPELAQKRFFSNDEAIYAAFEEVLPVPPITMEYYWGFDTDVDSAENFAGYEHRVPGWQVRFHYAPDFRPKSGAMYTIHGDMAVSGDRAGVAMTHVRTWDRRDWVIPGNALQMESRPVVKVDYVGAFEADPRVTPAPREVQIRWYRKLIWELRSRGFYIAAVSFDNFQSTDSMQILQSWGIEARHASTDRSTVLYDNLKDVMYDGRLEGYYEPVLVGEIQRLSKIRNGKIDHPPDGSKDLADALAGAVSLSVEFGGDEGETVEFSDTDSDLSLYMDGAGGGSELTPDGMYGVGLGMDGGGLNSFQW